MRLDRLAAMLRPMPQLGRMLALLATIMLVIGGAPAVAELQPCDPCPPDCPMMEMAAATVPDHQEAPDSGGMADAPCKQALACQPGFTATAPSQAVGELVRTAEVADHRFTNVLPAYSRPPDRNLRPPIQL